MVKKDGFHAAKFSVFSIRKILVLIVLYVNLLSQSSFKCIRIDKHNSFKLAAAMATIAVYY